MRRSKFLFFVFGFLIAATLGAKSSSNSDVVHVNGYTKKDGTYVAPYDRTAPNSPKNDNWSTKGNVNPETGKPGTKNSDAVASPLIPTVAGASSASTPSIASPPASTAVSLAPQAAAKTMGLGKLHAGMTKTEVTTLLGEPNIKSAVKWFYSGVGWVTFNPQGRSTAFGNI